MPEMIDKDETDYIPMNDASQFIPGRPHRATVWRWCLKGVRRHGEMVRLKTVAVGGRRYTTRADIESFLTACNVRSEAPPPVVSDSFRRRAEAAGEMLNAMGVR